MAGSTDGFTRQLRNKAVLLVGFAGFVCLLAGTTMSGHPAWQSVLFGVGASLIAAAVATWLSLDDSLGSQGHVFLERITKVGLDDVFTDRSQLGDEFWSDLIQNARHRYMVVGVASHRYARSEDSRRLFAAAFTAAYMRGAEVEIMFLNPNSPLAEIREREEGRSTRADTAEAIKWFWAVKSALPGGSSGRFTLLEYESTPTCGITWCDDRIIVSTYLARELNVEAPGFMLRDLADASSLATAYRKNYQELRTSAVEIGADRATELGGLANGWRLGRQSESELRPGAADHQNPQAQE